MAISLANTNYIAFCIIQPHSKSPAFRKRNWEYWKILCYRNSFCRLGTLRHLFYVNFSPHHHSRMLVYITRTYKYVYHCHLLAPTDISNGANIREAKQETIITAGT